MTDDEFVEDDDDGLNPDALLAIKIIDEISELTGDNATRAANILVHCFALVTADSSAGDYDLLVKNLQAGANALSKLSVDRFNFLMRNDPGFRENGAQATISKLQGLSKTKH